MGGAALCACVHAVAHGCAHTRDAHAGMGRARGADQASAARRRARRRCAAPPPLPVQPCSAQSTATELPPATPAAAKEVARRQHGWRARRRGEAARAGLAIHARFLLRAVRDLRFGRLRRHCAALAALVRWRWRCGAENWCRKKKNRGEEPFWVWLRGRGQGGWCAPIIPQSARITVSYKLSSHNLPCRAAARRVHFTHTGRAAGRRGVTSLKTRPATASARRRRRRPPQRRPPPRSPPWRARGGGSSPGGAASRAAASRRGPGPDECVAVCGCGGASHAPRARRAARARRPRYD